MQEWLKRSPIFQLDKVTAPLLVAATAGWETVVIGEPYAILRAMKKPVDLVIQNTTEHVLTNPRVRLSSQGGTVDWFRFWLKGEEDTDPAKAEQYAR